MKKAKKHPDPGRLRVLILEDNPADAELIELQLRRAKIGFTSLLVEGKGEFKKALVEFQPQVILSDFKLPAFDGLAALEISRQKAPDTPLIFVSGSIGEEKAIETLALGACDYIFKDNLARLGPAVKRVVAEAQLKREKDESNVELHRRTDEMRLLAEASDRFVHLNDLDHLYGYLAQLIRNISGADYLLLSLFDEKLQAVRPKILSGFEPFLDTIRRRLHLDPMQMVFHLKDMQPDDFSDFVSRRLLPMRDGLYGLANRKVPRAACRFIERRMGIADMHTMGFSWENQLFGGVTVFFKKGNALKNASQVEALVNLAAVAIKRLLAERSLRTSEGRFRHISETMSDISYSCQTDLQGNYTLSWIAGAIDHIVGYSENEIMALGCWSKLVLAEDLSDFEKYVTGLAPGNSGICELRLRHKDGSIIWVQSFAQCMENPESSGQPLLYGGLVDISVRKQMYERLRQSEEYYRILVETSPDAIVIVDAGGRITFASTKAQELFGVPVNDDINGMSMLDFVEPEEKSRVQKRLVEILSGRSQPQIKEYRLRRRDGQPFWGEVSSSPLKDARRHEIGLLLVCRDVSERKRNEDALRESEAKYRLIADNTAETITVLDLDLKFTYVSPSIFKLRGYTVEEALRLTIEQTLTPESLASIQEILGEEMALEKSGSADPQRSRTLELQEYHKDGSIVWIENSISFLRDPRGKAIAFLAVSKDISERKKAEAALRESEEKYRSLVTQSPDGIFIMDLRGNFLSVNQAMCAGLKYSEAEFLSLNIRDIVPEQYLDLHQERLAEIALGKPQNNVAEYEVKSKNGETHYIGILSTPYFRAGELVGFQGIARDITERKRADTLQLIQYKIANAMITADTLESLLETTRRELGLLLDTSNFLVALHDEARAMLFTPFDANEKDDIPEWPVEKSLTGLVIRQRKSLVLNREQIGRLAENGEIRLIGSRAESWLGVPLRIGDRILGAIVVQSYDKADAYKQNDVTMLEIIASQLSIYIERKQAEAQRQAALEALRQSEDRYRDLVENSQDIFCTHDLEGKLLSVNEAAIRLTGYSRDELLRMNLADLLVPGVRHLIKGYLDEIRATGRAHGTMRIQTSSGEARHWEYDNTLRTKDVAVPLVRAVAHDITERDKAEAEILRQKSFLEKLIEAAPEGIAITDCPGRVLQVNNEFLNMFGYQENEAVGKMIDDLIVPRGFEEEAGVLTQSSGGGKQIVLETVRQKKNGTRFNVSIIGAPIYIAEQQVAVYAIYRDISERKRAEDELKKLAAIVQTSSELVNLATLEGKMIFLNEAGSKILGIEPDKVGEHGILEVIPESFLPTVRQVLLPALLAGNTWEGELQYRNVRSGRLTDVHAMTFTIKDPDSGAPLYLANVSRDITEHKQAEEQIRASLKEKEVLLQEIHHRVKNNLQIVSGLLTLQADQATGKNLDEIFRESQDRIRSIALVHEKLYQSHNLAEIAFDEYLRVLVDNLLTSHSSISCRVAATYEMEKIPFTIEKAIPLGLIVNELVTNAIKHAFPNNRRGEIRIGLRENKAGKFQGVKTESGTLYRVPSCELIIADNGVGLPDSSISGPPKTLGLQLVSMLAEQLQAQLKVKTGPGTEFRLLFAGIAAHAGTKNTPV
jgi:PAS domain S-box-containing protein